MYISIFNRDFHFHLFFTVHSFFWSFSLLPAKQYSEGKTGWRTATEFPAKKSYKCTCLTVLRETLYQTQTILVIFSLPGKCSPTHFLKVALLPVLWIYTFLCNFSHTSGDPQTPGKKLTAFYTGHMRYVSTLGTLGVTEIGRLLIHNAY